MAGHPTGEEKVYKAEIAEIKNHNIEKDETREFDW